MRKSAASSLLAIVALALVLRLSPLTRFVYFGSDVGEYFRISHGLATTGHVALPYPGWGVTYPYFPGMFFLVAGTSFGGLEIGGSLSIVVPALAALIPAIVFLVAVRVLHEPSVGLLAAAFVAVAMPHAFQTAHPIPATVGELLAVSILLLWLRLPKDHRTWALLVPATLALVVTHHLSAYFLIVMLLIGLVVVGVVRASPLEGNRARALYVAFLAGAALAFWLGYATTFRTSILTDVDIRPWWLPLAGFPVLVGILVGAVILRRRFSWRYRPRYPSLRHVVAGYGVALGFIYALMSSAVFVGIIGTRIRLSPEVLWYFLPFFSLLAMAGAGRKHMDFTRRGLESGGWFLALALSAAFGAAAAARVIIPYRHVEYMVVVLAIPVGAGFLRLVELGGLSHRVARGGRGNPLKCDRRGIRIYCDSVSGRTHGDDGEAASLSSPARGPRRRVLGGTQRGRPPRDGPPRLDDRVRVRGRERYVGHRGGRDHGAGLRERACGDVQGRCAERGRPGRLRRDRRGPRPGRAALARDPRAPALPGGPGEVPGGPVHEGVRQRVRPGVLRELGSRRGPVPMKVAIVHDWMTTLGGGEKVVLTLAQALGAEIVTSELDPDVPRKAGFEGVRVRPIAALPRNQPWRTIAATRAFSRLELHGVDIVVLSGNWVVHAAPRNRPNLYYCHTPTRVL